MFSTLRLSLGGEATRRVSSDRGYLAFSGDLEDRSARTSSISRRDFARHPTGSTGVLRRVTLPSGTQEGDRMTLAGHGLHVGPRHGDLRVAVRLVPPVPGSRTLEEALAGATFRT